MARRNSRINEEWETPKDDFTWEHVKVEVLMDIRALLQRIVVRLDCSETLRMPASLREIACNTRKPRQTKSKQQE